MENKRMNEVRRPHSIFFPILLVVMGIFLLLANLGTIQNTAWGILSTYWPLIFIIGGLDGLYQRDGWVGPMVGIGLGTVLLLGNLHYLQWNSLELLLRLWPVLLIAWGLDVAFGHDHSVWNTLGRVVLGLLLVAGIIWLAVASPLNGGIKTSAFTQSLDGAQQSSLKFSMAAGELSVSGGAASSLLVDGSIGLPNNMTLSPDYQAPESGRSQLTLEGAGVVLEPFTASVPWKLKINPDIPLDLTTRMGVGNIQEDLTKTHVESVNSDLAVGQTVLTLPATGNVTGKIQVAVGELVLRVPKSTHLILHANIGAAGRQLPAGYTNQDGVIDSNTSSTSLVELTVNVAVGDLVIQEIP